MTKTVSTSKKPRKQHSPEFRSEALKLAERIGVTAAARELSLYESQLYNWRSKQQNQQTSSERELEMSTEIARGFVNGMVASHLLCHSGTINRHSLNGALLS
ncbi:transposase IS3 [Klebsiella pneumoniae]|nr:transposase IS3 [Klebsiella pneumoniae]